MKHILTIFFFFCFSIRTNASKKVEADTIYIKCFQEQQSLKFNSIGGAENRLSISYTFEVDYTMYKGKKNSILFVFKSPVKKEGATNAWVIKEMDAGLTNLLRNVLSLEQFTKKLKDADFCIKLIRKEVELIMLYGTKCSTRFEMFPVTVGTDLYDPNHVFTPEKSKDKN